MWARQIQIEDGRSPTEAEHSADPRVVFIFTLRTGCVRIPSCTLRLKTEDSLEVRLPQCADPSLRLTIPSAAARRAIRDAAWEAQNRECARAVATYAG